MAYEIERKYLIKNDSWRIGLTEADSSFIQQAYLSVYPEPTVRVRIKDSQAFLTLKGENTGITRAEYEYKIPLKDALELIKMAVSSVVVKRRYEIKYMDKLWEVDEFFGENEGLITAEIELDSEKEEFECPEWLGDDISYDSRYKNSSLASSPYKNW